MKPATRLLLAVALVSAAAGSGLYQWLASDGRPGATRGSTIQLAAIPLTDLEQRETRLADWGRELLVVNFWAPWCAPCRREIPTLLEIRDRYGDRQVEIIGIAFDNLDQVKRFADDYSIDYPLFLAGHRAGMYNQVFGNLSGSLPFTAILDRDLNIIYTHNGEMNSIQLSQAIDKFLQHRDLSAI